MDTASTHTPMNLSAILTRPAEPTAMFEPTARQREWLAHSSDGLGPGDVIAQVVAELRGELDPAALRRAWAQLIAATPVLRASFQAAQLRIHPHTTLDWLSDNWNELAPREQAERLTNYLTVDRQRGIGLREPPLHRVALFRVAATDYRLVWSYHRALCTPTECWQLLAYLFATVHDTPLPILPGTMRGVRPAHGDENFWRESLSGASSSPHLPVAERVRALRAIRPPLAGPVEWQAALALWLARTTGSDDVLFALNTDDHVLPRRVRLPAGITVFDWLGQLQREDEALRAHADVALPEIHSWTRLSSIGSELACNAAPHRQRFHCRDADWQLELRAPSIRPFSLRIEPQRAVLECDRQYDAPAILGTLIRLAAALKTPPNRLLEQI